MSFIWSFIGALFKLYGNAMPSLWELSLSFMVALLEFYGSPMGALYELYTNSVGAL